MGRCLIFQGKREPLHIYTQGPYSLPPLPGIAVWLRVDPSISETFFLPYYPFLFLFPFAKVIFQGAIRVVIHYTECLGS